MTRFVLILGLFINTSAFAGFMSGSDIAKVNAGEHGTTTYVRKGLCQFKEGEACYSIKGHDVRRESLQDVREGDWEAAEDIEACADQAACEALVGSKVCAGPEYSVFHGDLDEDGSLEAWCTRRGLVKKIKPDAALESADDARALAEQDKENRKSTAKSQLRAAIADWENLTAGQQKQVLRHLVRLLLNE